MKSAPNEINRMLCQRIIEPVTALGRTIQTDLPEWWLKEGKHPRDLKLKLSIRTKTIQLAGIRHRPLDIRETKKKTIKLLCSQNYGLLEWPRRGSQRSGHCFWWLNNLFIENQPCLLPFGAKWEGRFSCFHPPLGEEGNGTHITCLWLPYMPIWAGTQIDCLLRPLVGRSKFLKHPVRAISSSTSSNPHLSATTGSLFHDHLESSLAFAYVPLSYDTSLSAFSWFPHLLCVQTLHPPQHQAS